MTHDYLVPSLRTWLTRKQRATRHGRAELRLADLAALWTAKPESRRLPSLFEFFRFASYAAQGMERGAAEDDGRRRRDSMHCAGWRRWSPCTDRRRGLAISRPASKPANCTTSSSARKSTKSPLVVDDMWPGIVRGPTRWLKQDNDDAKQGGDEGRASCASLALLPVDESQVEYLYDRCSTPSRTKFDGDPPGLAAAQGRADREAWAVVEVAAEATRQRLARRRALALYAPDDPRWQTPRPESPRSLLAVNPFFVGTGPTPCGAFRTSWSGPLSGIARDPDPAMTNERLSATNILAACAADRPELLTELVLIDGDEKQFAIVFTRNFKELGDEPCRCLTANWRAQRRRSDAIRRSERGIGQRKARGSRRPAAAWPAGKGLAALEAGPATGASAAI